MIHKTILVLLVVVFMGCSSKKYLIVETEPSEAYVYIKGDPEDDLPPEKALIGKSPFKKDKIKYKNYRGDEIEKDVSELLEKEVDFFLIVEKDCYESQSIRCPPAPEKSITLKYSAKCEPEKKIGSKH